MTHHQNTKGEPGHWNQVSKFFAKKIVIWLGNENNSKGLIELLYSPKQFQTWPVSLGSDQFPSLWHVERCMVASQSVSVYVCVITALFKALTHHGNA